MKSSIEYFCGDELAANVWMNKYALRADASDSTIDQGVQSPKQPYQETVFDYIMYILKDTGEYTEQKENELRRVGITTTTWELPFVYDLWKMALTQAPAYEDKTYWDSFSYFYHDVCFVTKCYDATAQTIPNDLEKESLYYCIDNGYLKGKDYFCKKYIWLSVLGIIYLRHGENKWGDYIERRRFLYQLPQDFSTCYEEWKLKKNDYEQRKQQYDSLELEKRLLNGVRDGYSAKAKETHESIVAIEERQKDLLPEIYRDNCSEDSDRASAQTSSHSSKEANDSSDRPNDIMRAFPQNSSTSQGVGLPVNNCGSNKNGDVATNGDNKGIMANNANITFNININDIYRWK